MTGSPPSGETPKPQGLYIYPSPYKFFSKHDRGGYVHAPVFL
jgi:hypothetical protein